MIELAANLIVASLLVLTTSWCVLLYRRLDRLRVDRSDIETFLSAIEGAAQRAEQAIAGIRDGAAEAQQRLGAELETAQHRATELNRLVEAAGRVARRVETAIHQGARAMAEDSLRRDRDRSAPQPPQDDQVHAQSDTRTRKSRERSGRPRINAELLKVLEALQ